MYNKYWILKLSKIQNRKQLQWHRNKQWHRNVNNSDKSNLQENEAQI